MPEPRTAASFNAALPKRVRSAHARRLAEPGWVLMPLRLFLGGTFSYAGLQKLADKHFFDPHASSSVQAQLRAAARTSPLGGLMTGAGHHATLVGLAIALGELAVGLGTLAGLWARVAATGGAVLSASFLLAVSWHARPFYYGPDIVFLFAWLPLIIVGTGGVLSVDAFLVERAREELAVPPAGPVSIEFAAVRRLCGAYERGSCRARNGRPCEPDPCPVLWSGSDVAPRDEADLTRRDLLLRARAAGVVAIGATGLAAATAVTGRVWPSTPAKSSPVGDLLPAPTSTATAPSSSPQGSPGSAASTVRPPGTPVGPASAVPTGGTARFTDPSTGDPAYALRTTAGYRAFSAVCTHAGCTVDFSSADNSFQCPCHGAVFDARTGAVLQGPARRALPAIPIAEGSDGQLYVR